jgi:hypothetical protein
VAWIPFSDGTPVAMGKEMFIIPWLSIDALGEHRNHVLVCLLVKVMDLVSLVEYISHDIRRGSVRNGRRDDIGHVSGVLVFSQPQLRVRVETTDSSQMNIATTQVSKRKRHP